MSNGKLPARSPKYSENEIEHALTAMAFSRTPTEASELLKREGTISPSPDTIRKWRDRTHTHLYLQIRERTAQQREQLIINKIEPAIDYALDVAVKGLEKLEARLEKDDVADPAGAARNAATVAGILVDKKLSLEGRPTSTIEHRNPAEILRLLAQRGKVQTVEASADEVVDES